LKVSRSRDRGVVFITVATPVSAEE